MAAKPVTHRLPRIHHLPLTQARVHLGAVVKQARLQKDLFILEKDGIPVAGLMDIDAFEDYLELQDPRIRAHIRESHRQYVAGKSRPAGEFLQELRQAARRRIARRRKR